MKKDLAAFDLESTKRIKAIQEEREMEMLLEARARRAIAAVERAKGQRNRLYCLSSRY